MNEQIGKSRADLEAIMNSKGHPCKGCLDTPFMSAAGPKHSETLMHRLAKIKQTTPNKEILLKAQREADKLGITLEELATRYPSW